MGSIILQGFNWTSHRDNSHYRHVKQSLGDMKRMITKIWLPPSSKSRDPEGYYPLDYYALDSAYGSEEELRSLVDACREESIDVMGELVCWYNFDGIDRFPYKFRGEEIDVQSDHLYEAYEKYVLYMKNIGFTDIRMDFLKSKECYDIGLHMSGLQSVSELRFTGEYWTAMNYDNGYLLKDQNCHRQEIVNYIDKTDGKFHMFDFTLKGVLQEALNNNEYWRLSDDRQMVPGVNGWYASNAVTFIDNHDTLGQHLWPFSYDRNIVIAGYAYILTHPGTPCIYYDHFYDLRSELERLCEIRQEMTAFDVVILQADDVAYKAKIGNIKVQIGMCEHESEILFQTNKVLISAC